MHRIHMRQIGKGLNILRREGLRPLVRRVASHGEREGELQRAYRDWIKRSEPAAKELAAQREHTFSHKPLISFLCPAYNTRRRHLRALVRSLMRQTYSNWELCIADGGSRPHCVRMLRRLAWKNPRIRVAILGKNLGIARNTQEAAELARGDFFAFIDHDDTLAPFAAYALAKAVNDHPEADFFYSDEDKISATGRFDPRFKPDWSPDTLHSYNYITHLMMLSRTLFLAAGGLREGYDGSQDHDLALRAGERANKVVHIPQILYHWRAHRGSVAGSDVKEYALEAGQKAVQSALRRETNFSGESAAESGLFPSSYRARYPVAGRPLVSIVVPNRNKAAMLRRCVNSVEDTAQGDVEWIIVENGSDEDDVFRYYERLNRRDNAKIIAMDGPFNYSRANNLGAREAKGELLLFLNNDILAREDGWMQAMAEHALRRDVGAVGAKLLYEDGSVQHAGVVVGMGGWADHVCAGASEHSTGFANHLINVARNVSAVTGACLMTERKKFEDAGGFDERFVLCGSDVELCLRYLKHGLRNIYTPYARLIHLESATRREMRIPQEDFDRSYEAYLPWLLCGDPYYNLNLDYASRQPVPSPDTNPPIRLNPIHAAGRA